jgi:hypothetical protein
MTEAVREGAQWVRGYAPRGGRHARKDPSRDQAMDAGPAYLGQAASER